MKDERERRTQRSSPTTSSRSSEDFAAVARGTAHAHFFTSKVVAQKHRLRTGGPRDFARMQKKQPDVRTALDWTMTTGDWTKAAHLLYGSWFFFFLTIARPPRPTLFPYTTLFR